MEVVEDSTIGTLDASGKVLLQTVKHLLPTLHLGDRQPESVNMADVLGHFSAAARQLDFMWTELEAQQSSLRMNLLAPKDTPMHAPNALVPQLLSTMVPAEDAACIPSPDPQLLRLEACSQAEVDREAAAGAEAGAGTGAGTGAGGAGTDAGVGAGRGRPLGVELELAMRVHNTALDRLLEHIGGVTEEWRGELKRERESSSKRQRL